MFFYSNMGQGGKDSSVIQKKNAEVTMYSMQEVQKHKKANDAWIVFNNKVYDVSNWNGHPGGNILFTQAGQDATESFIAFHPMEAYAQLDKFWIGTLVKEQKQAVSNNEHDHDQCAADFRLLRAKMKTQKLFDASGAYYLYKVATNVALASLSIYLAVQFGANSFIITFISATIMGLFYQQCGWLSHDFLHHQVIEHCTSRYYLKHFADESSKNTIYMFRFSRTVYLVI